jgi:hypothetical protein
LFIISWSTFKAYLSARRSISNGLPVSIVITAVGRKQMARYECTKEPPDNTSRNTNEGKSPYFGADVLANSMPFSMLPLRPLTQASRSFFSCSVTPSRMLIAFSAPLGYIEPCQLIVLSNTGNLERLTPSSTGMEKNSRPVALAISSPPVTPGR